MGAYHVVAWHDDFLGRLTAEQQAEDRRLQIRWIAVGQAAPPAPIGGVGWVLLIEIER